MKYLADIKWSWELEETKEFNSAEERQKYISNINEDDVDGITLREGTGVILKTKKFDPFYSPMREMSDYEMDMFL